MLNAPENHKFSWAQGVGGSNPLAPTNLANPVQQFMGMNSASLPPIFEKIDTVHDQVWHQEK
jgi:hypothetical protein